LEAVPPELRDLLVALGQIDVVQGVAEPLDVAEASVDWLRSLETIPPDIVSLATF
jgi:hypothetical protein